MVLSSMLVWFRGERTANHVQEKGISKMHRQPLRVWEGKDHSFDAQHWTLNPARSFHQRNGSNGSYPTGPGDRYANWDNTMVRLSSSGLVSAIIIV